MSDLAALLAGARLRVTPQRLRLLELVNAGGHLTADDLYRMACRGLPGLSATSIYKSLHALQAAGLVREVYLGAGPVRYDANLGRHHHRICRSCGRIEDVACPASSGSGCVDGHELGDFSVDRIEITYRGLCGDCRSPRETGPAVAGDEEAR